MAKLYVVGFRWMKDEPKVADFQRHMDPLGNWFRLNFHIWLLYSDLPASEVSRILNPKIGPDNSIFVIAADKRDYAGYAPKMLWEWLKKLP